MTTGELERRIRDLRPDPPADLRGRVLTAAPVAPIAVTWSDRVWFSRAWRIAAAAVLVAALAVEGLAHAAAPGGDVSTQAAVDARVIDETGREIGLPATLTTALAERTLVIETRRAAAVREQAAMQTLHPEGERR